MNNDKLKNLDKKIQELQERKKKVQANLEKNRIETFKKIGLFDLDEDEMLGLILDGLKQKDDDKVRGAWKNQGKKFLSDNKKISQKK